MARARARRDAARGDLEAERLHVGEAAAHEAAARAIEQTAALYRGRLRRLTINRDLPEPVREPDGLDHRVL